MDGAVKNPTKPVSKLFIGFIGGLCAAFFPRLTAALAAQNDNLTFFPLPYVILGLVFAMLIGVVVMILQAEGDAKPLDTFMMALGIPAMLTGALNANLNTETLKKLDQTQNLAAQAVREQAQIPVLPPKPIKSIKLKDHTSFQFEHNLFFSRFMGSSPSLCPSRYAFRYTVRISVWDTNSTTLLSRCD